MKPDNKSKNNISRRVFIQGTAAGVMGIGAGAAFSCAAPQKEAGANDVVTLEILEPHGELAFPERQGLSAPRLNDLNGKKIAIMAMGQDSIDFFVTIKSMLKEKYPAIEFIHFSYGGPNSPDITAEIADKCDGWIDGVKAAEEGYTKQALKQMLCDKHRAKWEALNDTQKAQIKKAAAAGTIPGLTLKDCKPGGTIPTINPNHIALLVVGGAVGQCAGFYSMGTVLADPDHPDAPKPDFITKKVHGAALTKAGR